MPTQKNFFFTLIRETEVLSFNTLNVKYISCNIVKRILNYE